MPERPIVIAGAGLAGLSAAYHLGRREYRLLEREARPGGLCRTEKSSGYMFDYGGHLLHLRGEDARALALKLLGSRLDLYPRRSAIFSQGALTPYPFQANTHGLPPTVVRDCLLGFVEALLNKDRAAPDNFHDFILASFGEGFARHFFFPFNQKFFKRDLHEVTADWVSWSIPRPNLGEVVNGALGLTKREFGYNVEFYYPTRGGIEELPQALTKALARPVETGVELREVIPAEKRAVLSTGEEISYDRLISTAPLDRLLAMLRNAPAELSEAAKKLRVLSVLCVNLGLAGPPLSDQHWIYIPEPEYRFHRIGVYSNFMALGPGKNALYLELTLPGPVGAEAKAQLAELSAAAVAEFKGLPFFRAGEHRLEVVETMLIEHGYVVYDRFRQERLPAILAYLRNCGIEPAGRYGRWEYSTMEDAIREGKEAATAVSG